MGAVGTGFTRFAEVSRVALAALFPGPARITGTASVDALRAIPVRVTQVTVRAIRTIVPLLALVAVHPASALLTIKVIFRHRAAGGGPNHQHVSPW